MSLGIEFFTQTESLNPLGRGFGLIFLVFGDRLFSDFSARFLHIWLIFKVGENGKNVKNLDHEKPDPRTEFRAERGLYFQAKNVFCF